MSWLSERLSEVRARMAPVRTRAAPRLEQARQWLSAQGEPLTWATLRAKLTTPSLPSTNGGRLVLAAGIVVLLLLLLLVVLPWYARPLPGEKGAVTYPHASLINPILAGLGALFLIYAAIRQAQIAADRHSAQTNADLQRRTTETFSKAIEQLGSDKLEVRLGGIYALERISKESPDDYWTVMENLTAFVRERSQRTEADRKPLEERIKVIAYSLWEGAGKPDGRSEEFWEKAVEEEEIGVSPATDIQAVLTVIMRRSDDGRAREAGDKRALDFTQAVLRAVDLHDAHLEDAILIGAHLERALLANVHLERAFVTDAHLQHAYLLSAHLEGADLGGAHFEDSTLVWAHLERALLLSAYLEGANLSEAHLEGANLIGAHLEGADLTRARLELAFTRLEGPGQTTNENAHFEGADLDGAHLEGADLRDAEGLTQAQINEAFGDAATKLPEGKGLTRPAHWTDPTAPRISKALTSTGLILKVPISATRRG